jgi:hypothetical protein
VPFAEAPGFEEQAGIASSAPTALTSVSPVPSVKANRRDL